MSEGHTTDSVRGCALTLCSDKVEGAHNGDHAVIEPSGQTLSMVLSSLPGTPCAGLLHVTSLA